MATETAIYRNIEIKCIGILIFVIFHGVPYPAKSLEDAKEKIDKYWKDKGN